MHPASLESRAQISEDLTEMREQLRKQVIRLRELRIRKVEEPGECSVFGAGRSICAVDYPVC